jgi:asparagine synthase (glutamine-hydrolysing)
MFAGYDRYLGNQLVDLYCLLPAPVRRHMIEPLIRRLPDSFSYNNRVQKLRWMVAMSGTSQGERYAESASFLRFNTRYKESLYTTELWREIGQHDSSEHLLRYFNAENASHAVDKMLYTDVKTRLADHLLMVVDRMTMAHSLEGRSPYVDQEVVELAAAIPASMKLHRRRLKYILRKVAEPFLPETLIQRRKQGFGFPLAYWFRNELRPLMSNLCRSSSLVAGGYFRADAMQTLLNEHVSGRVDHNYRLWLLLNLELWHKLFIERQRQDDLQAWLEADHEAIHAHASFDRKPMSIQSI